MWSGDVILDKNGTRVIQGYNMDHQGRHEDALWTSSGCHEDLLWIVRGCVTDR